MAGSDTQILPQPSFFFFFWSYGFLWALIWEGEVIANQKLALRYKSWEPPIEMLYYPDSGTSPLKAEHQSSKLSTT